MRPDVAVLLLTQVNFRSGQLHDIQRLTELARAQGILVLWDLAHSAGVIPLKLDEWGVDMAVGCGYKFLNGGPGAPAFLYLAQRHQEQAVQPLSGWMGHRAAFEFSPGYVPAEGIRRFLSGTPGILGMSALDSALDVFERVTVEELRNKSLALSDLFIGNIDGCEELAGLKLLTPRDHASRGSQVSLSHAEAYAISQALIDAGVIVDFRTPDVIRFGFSPLYNRFVDVIGAVEALKEVFTTEVYREDRFRQRRTVT
jgi:kynureninase